jgi:hypothetical protein
MTPTLEVEVDLVVVDEDLQEELVATTIDELGDSLIKSHVGPRRQPIVNEDDDSTAQVREWRALTVALLKQRGCPFSADELRVSPAVRRRTPRA